jgi:hypothetical protein
VRPEEIGKLQKRMSDIVTRTRDLPACNEIEGLKAETQAERIVNGDLSELIGG